MPRQTSTEVKLEYILKELAQLKKGQDELRADINRGKGAIWLLLVISAMISGFYNYFK